MVYATADGTGRAPRLRYRMVGGGRGAFIGAVHRFAARLDDLYRLEAGAKGIRFVEAALHSAKANGSCTKAHLEGV